MIKMAALQPPLEGFVCLAMDEREGQESAFNFVGCSLSLSIYTSCKWIRNATCIIWDRKWLHPPLIQIKGFTPIKYLIFKKMSDILRIE